MSADSDLCSPNKQPRTETTPTDTPTTPHPSPSTTTTLTATTSTPTATTTATACIAEKESSAAGCPPCLETKDSIIAQILAGSDADFSETGLCPPGVFFDDSCYPTTSTTTPCSFSPHNSWSGEQPRTPIHPIHPASHHHSTMMTSSVAKDTRSLLVTMESRGCSLQHNIEQVVTDHELITCSPSEALTLCSERMFQLIWLHLPCPPSEDILAVITGIRYNSKYNKKTIQLGVTVTQPEIDLNLHGIDEIILEPVSKATIRQKYFDWTSAKLTPDYGCSLRDTSLSPTTPDSSVSAESNIELSLSSLASDTTNDSGIHGEVDMVDLKPPPPFLFPPQHGVPVSLASKLSKHRSASDGLATPPTWCRAEHATKEKHRRERIKDSCDQLRVLLPYVRGRKTDMASILEMTVDYLKIVNSKLPHDFHAHVLDVMTKGGNSPPLRQPRSNVSSGRGSRGGRGRGCRRSTASPVRALSLQDSAQSRMLTRSLSRDTTTSPVCTISSRGSRAGTKGTKGSSPHSVVMSPGSHGVSNLYLAEVKDRGGLQREESVIATSMSLPTYLPAPHHSAPHLFSDPPPSHCYPPPPHTAGPPSLTTSTPNECGLPVPRLYASAHLTVDPAFLSHGAMATPSPLATPMTTRYSLGGGEREGGGAASFGDPSPAYYHYFSNLPDMGPAYTLAGGGGMGGCGGGGAMCVGDYLSSGSPYPLSNSFPSTRLPVAPPRGKGDATPLSSAPGGDNPYGMTDTTPKTSK